VGSLGSWVVLGPWVVLGYEMRIFLGYEMRILLGYQMRGWFGMYMRTELVSGQGIKGSVCASSIHKMQNIYYMWGSDVQLVSG
jgi:hypothetical protein